MQTQLKRILLSAAILVAVFTVPLRTQTFGEVTGHISDASGAAVPAARISLTNVATNASRTTASTDSGDYTFPAVAPGFHNIRVEQTSFKKAGTSNFQVQVQQTLRLDFSLEVGQITESIEVSASALLLQSENVSLAR